MTARDISKICVICGKPFRCPLDQPARITCAICPLPDPSPFNGHQIVRRP
jgi:hypothetical protein